MDFTLSKQHLLLRDMYRAFAENEVKPLAEEVDEEERFPMETVKKLARYGFMGIPFPKKYGGAGGDVLAYAMAVEELSKACATTGVIVSAHTSLCCAPIYENGTEEQKMQYLPKLLSGEWIGAFGFLVAAVGFCLVDLFNRSERMTFRLSPLFLSIVAFCFSMTVGVLWEFFEFSMDQLLHMDMQKDFLVQNINSVLLNPSGLNVVVHEPINSLVVNGQDWMEFPGGYVDIGLIDTMKDLMVNFIGAVVFSIIGFFYVKTRGKGRIAASLIPVVLSEKEKKKE